MLHRNKYSRKNSICTRCSRKIEDVGQQKCPHCGGNIADRDQRKKDEERKVFSAWWKTTQQK